MSNGYFILYYPRDIIRASFRRYGDRLMIRAFFGLAILPLILSGLIVRLSITTKAGRLAAMLCILSACTGCAAIIDKPARACHNAADTVAAMQACNARYPTHNGTTSDIIAAPLGTLERSIIHRNHSHTQAEPLGWYQVEIDGQSVYIWASSQAQALELSRR